MAAHAVRSEVELRSRLLQDFEFYASTCLKIKPKEGDLIPFDLNAAQQILHAEAERQLAERGYVRIICLKGRQQGISTYVQGRFCWKTSNSFGRQAYILTHEESATNTLFGMGKRFYDNLPPYVKPMIKASNAKELVFGALDSSYKVGTAGNKATGRSTNNQLFHGSESAYWPNAAEHAAGVLQSVGMVPGTEVFLESTANGMGNYFHAQWQLAVRGESDFVAVFIPWFIEPSYRRPVPPDFVPTDEEAQLMRQYRLDPEQVLWRRYKTVELSAGGLDDGRKRFRVEYPFYPDEAFQATGGDGLIGVDMVIAARRARVQPGSALLVGVDPSRGGDRFSIIRRSRRKAWGLEEYKGEQVSALGKQVAILKGILDRVDPVANRKPDLMLIDAGGGDAIVDRLHELGYERRVKAVAFGGTPFNPEKYTNKRNEMWGEMAAWLASEDLPVELPDSDVIQSDLLASPFDRDSRDRRCLWSKDKIKREYGFSPDSGDALALTFAGYEPEHNWQPPQVKRR